MSGRSSGTANPQGEFLRVLLDGWPLVAEPNSPASIHIRELLRAGEQAEIEMVLALPAMIDPLPPEAVVAKTSLTDWGRLRWEQKMLSDLARRAKAHLLHSVTGSLPINCPVPCVFSPTGVMTGRTAGLVSNLREAVGRGGLSQARALLWPEDLPLPAEGIPFVPLPPHVHPAFTTTGIPPRAQQAGDYLFCPGPLDDQSLDRLALAWHWISSGLGEDWALVVDGISAKAADRVREQSGTSAPVLCEQDVTVGVRSGLMQSAAAVLLAGDSSPWGDPLLQALACARPIAAEETDWNSRRAGPAAYLTVPGDARMLGAAALTLLVEEAVAEGLSQAARSRAEAALLDSFPSRLSEAYHMVLG